MRIALDARQMFRRNRRGTGKNLIDLYKCLHSIRPTWNVILFHRQKDYDPLPPFPLQYSTQRIGIAGSDRLNLWEQFRLPLAAWLSKVNLIHYPANTGPWITKVPVVLTIHDLIPVEMQPELPATIKWLHRVRRAAHAARHIVTPSQYTRQQIIDILAVSPDKITVNYWAADSSMRRIEDTKLTTEVFTRYGVRSGRRYFFAFGASDPRKNTARLLKAYSLLPISFRKDVALVVVGLEGPVLTQFRTLGADLGISESLHLNGFALENDLPALLSGADALLFPSQSEGFGLPILDAFCCGTPVLTGNRTSLPEIAGDAALLIDPDDVESIRDGLQRLIVDFALREELARRGSQRLQHFTWEHTASTLASVFEQFFD